MNMTDFVQFIKEEQRITSVVHLNKVRQKLYQCSQLWSRMPQEFIDKWHLKPEHFMGLEWVEPGEFLDLHQDIGGRKCNILINIGKHPATIQHSNNGVTCDATIQPGEHFVLDTTKDHGCDNTKNPHRAEFLTVNIRKGYDECIALF